MAGSSLVWNELLNSVPSVGFSVECPPCVPSSCQLSLHPQALKPQESPVLSILKAIADLLHICVCVCAKYLIYSQQRLFPILLSLSICLPLCHFSFLPPCLLFFSLFLPSIMLLSHSETVEWECCLRCLWKWHLHQQTLQHCLSYQAACLIVSGHAFRAWPLMNLSIPLFKQMRVNSANNQQHTCSLCLCLRGNMIQGFLWWKMSVYLAT